MSKSIQSSTCAICSVLVVRALKIILESMRYLISSHLISSHLISSHLISSHLISSHLISSHLISSHLISSHLISSHINFIHNHPPEHSGDLHQKFAPTLGLLHPSFCPGGGDFFGQLPKGGHLSYKRCLPFSKFSL